MGTEGTEPDAEGTEQGGDGEKGITQGERSEDRQGRGF